MYCHRPIRFVLTIVGISNAIAMKIKALHRITINNAIIYYLISMLLNWPSEIDSPPPGTPAAVQNKGL